MLKITKKFDLQTINRCIRNRSYVGVTDCSVPYVEHLPKDTLATQIIFKGYTNYFQKNKDGIEYASILWANKDINIIKKQLLGVYAQICKTEPSLQKACVTELQRQLGRYREYNNKATQRLQTSV